MNDDHLAHVLFITCLCILSSFLLHYFLCLSLKIFQFYSCPPLAFHYEQVCVFAFYLSFLVPAGPGGKTSIIITNQTPVVSFSAPSVLFSVVHPMFLCSMRCHSQSMIYFFTHSLLPFFGALLQPSLLSLCFWIMSALCPFLPMSA